MNQIYQIYQIYSQNKMKALYLIVIAVVLMAATTVAEGEEGWRGGISSNNRRVRYRSQMSAFRSEGEGNTFRGEQDDDDDNDDDYCVHTYIVKRGQTKCRAEGPDSDVQDRLPGLVANLTNLRNDFEQLRTGLDLSDLSMPMAQLYTALQTISITAAELKAQAKAYCFFTLHPTGGLHGHNQRELSGLSEEQCVQACLDASDFFCRSIEFCGVDSCERGKCYLSAQSRDTVPADYDTWAHWDYLHRVCVGTPSPPAPTVTP